MAKGFDLTPLTYHFDGLPLDYISRGPVPSIISPSITFQYKHGCLPCAIHAFNDHNSTTSLILSCYVYLVLI